MTRLEHKLNQLWDADDCRRRHHGFRKRLRREPGALKAFDALITEGCYADLIVAGVMEIAHARKVPTQLTPTVRHKSRRHAQSLARAFEDLAEANAAAVTQWPSRVISTFRSDLTKTLQDEALRLKRCAEMLDGRHNTGARPHQITMFLAAVNHAKDVTGTYRDDAFARMFDSLDVTTSGELVSTETIRKWRQRPRPADQDNPRRPLVDRMRETWT